MEPVPFDDISATIRARHVLTPIEQVFLCPAEMAAAEAARVLEDGNFDFAPTTVADEIVGYVERVRLTVVQGAAGDQSRPLTETHLVSGDAPLAVLLEALRRAPFQIVIDAARVAGVVTPADLNKQPGRTYFYLLVAELELVMAEMLRVRFPEQQDAVAVLSAGRRAKVQSRLDEEVRDDVFADQVAAMDFVDLLTVVERSDDLRAKFGDYSRSRWKAEVCSPATLLRHDVMHTTRALASDATSSLERLVSLDTLLRELLKTAAVGGDRR